jgi:hypothetical protein
MNREIALSLTAVAVSLVVLRPTAAVTIDDDGYAEDNGRTSEFFTNFTVLPPDPETSDPGPSFADPAPAAPSSVDIIQSHDVTHLDPTGFGTVVFDFTDPVIARAVDPINTGLDVTRAYETRATWSRSIRAVPISTELDTPTPPRDPEVPGHPGGEAALEDTAALGNPVPLPAPAVLLLLAAGLAVPRVLRAR